MKDVEKWLAQLKEHRDFSRSRSMDEEPKEESSIDLKKPENPEQLKEDHEEMELEDNFKKQVQVAAYFISQAGYSYNDLCWFLAEKILKETYKLGTALSISDLMLKAEQINHMKLNYDELCWLNGELDIIIRKYFDK